ncbi:MAG TPA: flagellar export chaperone FliS [Candidatus Aerophobetes bacterium]|uniref:Flagellar secretion chaperone FliS n=1 Tax=Aerophobetes bacterium TaxID=2030807 RepID=A0A7V0MY94_UNCAE|nr:flagellar export chaperone FliS [Candidatus Aerophobetes bacterium]
MGQADALKKYREMEIKTSSPAKLILILYNEAIKCLNRAKEKIKVKNVEESNDLLIRAQKIIRELMCSLNLKVGEMATRWYSLYEYIYYRLIQANLQKDVQVIDEVLDLLKPLRDAWIKAMEEVNENRN